MRRSIILWVGVAALLAGILAGLDSFPGWSIVAAQQNAVPVRDPAQVRSTHVADGFTIAAVGDLIHRFPINQFPDVQRVAAILHQADIRVANCESSIVDILTNRVTQFGDMNADPSVANDLKALGFNLVGRANNHTFDWGWDGIRETDRRLDEAGIKHAGTGETLALARQAQFYDTPKGRVGMVSISSSFNPAGVATNPVGELPGRSGLNPLRTTRYSIVSSDEMQALRKIHSEQNQGLAENLSPPPVPPDELLLFGLWFKVGEKPGATYKLDPADERDILQNIRNGKGFSDFMVATMHTHQEPNCEQPVAGTAWKCGKPADFVEKIAHEAIDAGADVWVGTGPHVVLGIEIYKGKPIFYSLGNFTWQIELTGPRGRGADPSLGSEMDITEKFWSFYNRDETMEESVMAVSRYEKNQVVEIRLYPIDLGWSRRPADRGVPSLASPQMAQKILQRLQKMSSAYGTSIKIENNVGVIRVAGQPNTNTQSEK